MEQTKKNLRAVLLSKKGGVALDQLEIDYYGLVCFTICCFNLILNLLFKVGESLASQAKLNGFSSVLNFLLKSPDVCSLDWRGSSRVVRGVPSVPGQGQGVKHVAEMMMNQNEKRQRGKGRGRAFGPMSGQCVGVSNSNVRREKVSEDVGQEDDLNSNQMSIGRSRMSASFQVDETTSLESEKINISYNEMAQDFGGFEDLANGIKQIVLSEPDRQTETALREKLRNTGVIVEAGDLKKLLFQMAEAGVVELVKIGSGQKGIFVRPSVRTMREAKARESPERTAASNICKTIPAQQLPGHLREGSFISIVVTEVKSPGKFWFNLHEFSQHPVYYDAVTLLMDRMKKFYAEEGDRWRVESVLDCEPGTFLAAQYIDEHKVKQGFHRVVVKQVVDLKRLKLFYIDDGTVETLKLKHVRFLPTEFGQLPAQALEAQLWGVEQIDQESRWTPQSTQKFFSLVQTEKGELLAKIMEGVTRRKSRVDKNSNLFQFHSGLSLSLMRVGLGRNGTDIAQVLVAEGLAKWEVDAKSVSSVPHTVAAATAPASSALPEIQAESQPCFDILDAEEIKLREERLVAKLDKLCVGLGVTKLNL